MKSLIISLAITVITVQGLSAQIAGKAATDTVKTDNPNYRNSWYAEVGGASLAGVTFNYERFLFNHPWGLSVHGGFGGGYVQVFDTGSFFGSVPIGLSYNIAISKDKRSMIEVGGTYCYLFAYSGAHLMMANLSWRFETSSHKVQFRATLLPYVGEVGTSGPSARWFGFSIGKKF